MLKSKPSILFILLIISLALTNMAQAHKLNVFAYENGEKIICEATWAGGKKLASKVSISAKQGEKTIATGTTDQSGIFEFSAPTNKIDIEITADSGDGHMAKWLMPAEDIINNQSKQQAVKKDTKTSTNISEKELQILIRNELETQLAPIKRHIAAQTNAGPSLQDIIGGIGYIIGLLGLAAYFTSKGKK